MGWWPRRGFLRRVVRAVLVGAVTYLLTYYVPLMLFPLELIPPEYTASFHFFVAIVVLFSSLMEFFSDTVVYYALGVARVFLLTMFFVYTAGGGVLEATFVEEDATVRFVVDVAPLLTILVCMSLLDMARYALQAINFVVEREEGTASEEG